MQLSQRGAPRRSIWRRGVRQSAPGFADSRRCRHRHGVIERIKLGWLPRRILQRNSRHERLVQRRGIERFGEQRLFEWRRLVEWIGERIERWVVERLIEQRVVEQRRLIERRVIERRVIEQRVIERLEQRIVERVEQWVIERQLHADMVRTLDGVSRQRHRRRLRQERVPQRRQ